MFKTIASFNFSGVRLPGRIGPAIALTTLLLSAAAGPIISPAVAADTGSGKDDNCVTIPGRHSPFCGETSFKEFAYVANSSRGSISAYNVDTNTGALLSVPGKMFVSGKQGGGSLAADAKHRFLYVANPSDEDNNIAGFKINPHTGKLAQLRGSPFGTGLHPSFAVVDPSSRFLYVTNSGSNNVSVFTIDPNTGGLTPVAGSPFAAGAFPSSIAVDPNGRFALVTNELDATLSVYWIDVKTGALSPVTGVPAVHTGASPVSVVIDPVKGKFIFVANRGDDSLSVYTIEGDNGLVLGTAGSPFQTGPEPTAVTIDPSGENVYVSHAEGISAYAFNNNAEPCCPPAPPLTLLPGSPLAAGSNPYALTLDYSGTFAYIASKTASDVSGYKVSNGAFTPLPGSPYDSGAGPVSISLVVVPKAAYLTTDLGMVSPTAINQKGDVTGSQPVPGVVIPSAQSEPFLYSNGVRQGIPKFAGHQATGWAINDHQEIVGRADIISGFTFHAFLFSDGTTTDLDGRGLGGQSSAQALNDQGHIAGYISTTTSAYPPFIYHAFLDTDGTIQDIGTLGGYFSQAFGLNNLDEVTGGSSVSLTDGTVHMFVYRSGVFEDLGTLNGADTYGRKINDSGEILGFTGASYLPGSSFLYRNGTFHPLSTLGGTYSDGRGLNSSGAVVGTADVPNGGPTHAFLFLKGHITDLNELVDPTVPLLTWAADINDSGQIVATGLNGHGYLLTPKK